jgi:hypothetical protein
MLIKKSGDHMVTRALRSANGGTFIFLFGGLLMNFWRAIFTVLTGIPFHDERKNFIPAQPTLTELKKEKHVFQFVVGGYLWQKKLIVRMRLNQQSIKQLYLVMKTDIFSSGCRYSLFYNHPCLYATPQEATLAWYDQVGEHLSQCQNEEEINSLLQSTDKYYAILNGGKIKTNLTLPGFYSL